MHIAHTAQYIFLFEEQFTLSELQTSSTDKNKKEFRHYCSIFLVQ